MTMMPPEAPDVRCVFCKATREILPRCAKCNKLLGLMLTSPYDPGVWALQNPPDRREPEFSLDTGDVWGLAILERG